MKTKKTKARSKTASAGKKPATKKPAAKKAATRKPAARAARSKPTSPKRVSTVTAASREKYSQTGAPWWKAHL